MTVSLPSNLCARPISHVASSTVARRADQRSGNRVDTIEHVLSPLEDPISRDGNCSWQLRLDAGMNIDEIQWSRPGCREYAEIIAHREQRVEGAQQVCVRIISAGDVGFDAETRLQAHVREVVSCVARHGPCFDIRRTEGAKLPQCFIIEVPSGFFSGRGTEDPGSYRVAEFARRASLECCVLSIKSEVVCVHRDSSCDWPRRINAPKASRMVGSIVEESRVVEVGSH